MEILKYLITISLLSIILYFMYKLFAVIDSFFFYWLIAAMLYNHYLNGKDTDL